MDVDEEEFDPTAGELGLIPIFQRADGSTVTERGTPVDLATGLSEDAERELAESAIHLSIGEDLDASTAQMLTATLEPERPTYFRRSGWLHELYPVLVVDGRFEVTRPPVVLEHHPVFGLRPVESGSGRG